MSQELLTRGLFSGIFSLVFAWIVFSRYDEEIGSENSKNENQKYLPYISGNLLPLFLFTITVYGLIFYGAGKTAQLTLSMCFGIFLHISLYYMFLLLVLPLFRRHISARACAMLWIIPNYLYITNQSYMKLPKPEIVFVAPNHLIWVLFFLWFAGFVGVFSWKIIEHLLFRHEVLTDSFLVTDPQIVSIWEKTIEDARIKKPKFKLMISPNIKIPLSIGLFPRTARVLLPALDYEPEELELIFRHEIIHIAREDAWSKYFLVFCTAICWFHPLMWIAMKKSAEDMELSCDETVLLNADDATRKKYASLLLEHAGDGRGFTTCLSASAKTMRYRLKHITKPTRRHSGAIVVGIMFFILCMTSGYATLVYGGTSGKIRIYNSNDYSQYHLRYISMSNDEYNTDYEILDETAFHEYFSGSTLYEFTGNYSFSENNKQFTYLLDTPDGTLGIILYDHAIKLSPLWEGQTASYYYITEGIDWDYLDTIIAAHPAMNLHLTRKEGNGNYKQKFSARLDKLWNVVDGQKTLVFTCEYPDELHGLFGYDPFDEAVFDFSKPLAAPCSVFIESWNRDESCTITQTDITKPFVVELPPYAAHYTVYASFHTKDGHLYEAEFRFHIGEIEE